MINLMQRLRTLWRLSGFELDKEPTIMQRINQKIGRNQAIIVEDNPVEQVLKNL